MSNAIVQDTSHCSNGLLFASWNQDQGRLHYYVQYIGLEVSIHLKIKNVLSLLIP